MRTILVLIALLLALPATARDRTPNDMSDYFASDDGQAFLWGRPGQLEPRGPVYYYNNRWVMLTPAQLFWCRKSFKTWRVTDNTYVAKNGKRQFCWAPQL